MPKITWIRREWPPVEEARPALHHRLLRPVLHLWVSSLMKMLLKMLAFCNQHAVNLWALSFYILIYTKLICEHNKGSLVITTRPPYKRGGTLKGQSHKIDLALIVITQRCRPAKRLEVVFTELYCFFIQENNLQLLPTGWMICKCVATRCLRFLDQ